MNISNFLLFINIFIFLVKASIKVSVIIPVYNSGKYLERCLTSIINQTLNDIEIICIDDASTDNSLEILNEFKNKDNRITVVTFDQNSGPSAARNKGIELANGEFLSFIDSDDYADTRYIEYLYSYSKDYDVVVGKFVKGTNNSDNYFVSKLPHYKNGFLFNSLFRREFINKYKIKFPVKIRFMEDKAFRMRCYENNPKIIEAPDNGIYYYYKLRLGSSCRLNDKYLKKIERIAENETKKREIKQQL